VLSDAASSHLSWFGRARERVELDGVTLFVGEGDAILAFPGRDADLPTAVRIATRSGAREISCWALLPDDHLAARLSLLGFQDGWQPHWMGADPARCADEPGHEIEATTACSRALPYGSRHHESVLGGDVHHFVARDQGSIVGHVVLDTDATRGGIYDMGVAPSARGRGYGRALALTALACARAQGCTSVTLNTTAEGEPLYRSVGFESLDLGITWWLFPREARTGAPSS
jgi:ribosomal protein S18 acetylase RimI-like enzyme